MSDSGHFLDTAEGEISLFRSIMRTRPVGIHRHVHILAIHNSIYRDTGFKVPMEDIWAKLGTMYDLDVLEHAVSSLVLSPLDLGRGFPTSVVCSVATADTSVLDFLPHPPHYYLRVRPWDFRVFRAHRSSPAKIPPRVPTPHLPTKASRHTQVSQKNLTPPLTTSPSSPTSPLDVSEPPLPPQHHHHHPRQFLPAPGARRIPA